MEDRGILLESGTNEFEIIEFSIDGVCYGINVAKVREIVNPIPVTPMVNMHHYVDGMFTLRGNVMPMVNLPKCLNKPEIETGGKIIVCELNNYFVGFKVGEVSRIYRISWAQMEPAPAIVGSDYVIGIVKMDNRLIVLLDFEKILAELNPEINAKMTAVPEVTSDMFEQRKTKTLLIAEDSQMLRNLLHDTIVTAGYNVIAKENGEEAWNELEEMVKKGGPITDHVQLIVTDIEMPKMDGHYLTKKIKEDPLLKELPVVIFSSLINEEMKRKGESLGAFAQITKPEIEQLIGIVDKKILG